VASGTIAVVSVRGVAIFLVVLLGLLLALDRFGVAYAEDRVAAQLQEALALTRTPEVDITGFPALTQAIAGRYDDVRLQLNSADVAGLRDLDAVVELHGLRVTLGELFSEEVEAIPVERIDGAVSVPYATVAEQIGDGVTVARGEGGVMVTDTFEVLGQEVPVSGTGEVTVVGPQELAVTVVALNLAGIDIPDFLIEQLQEQLSFTYELPPWPFGLTVTDARATADGFDVTAEATDAVIDPNAIPTD